MTSHIFGVGLGLFVILTLWLSAGLIFLVSLRIERRIGAVALAVAAVVTVILVSVPRAPQHPAAVQENKPYDHFFIWRMILLILLAASSVISFVGYVRYGLMDIAKPARIKNWIL